MSAPKLTANEAALVAAYRDLCSKYQGMLLAVAQSLAADEDAKRQKESRPKFRLISGGKAAA